MPTNRGAEVGTPPTRASEPEETPDASRSAAPSTDVIRVIVAGDWAMVRTGLCHVVASRSNFTVVADCGSRMW